LNPLIIIAVRVLGGSPQVWAYYPATHLAGVIRLCGVPCHPDLLAHTQIVCCVVVPK